MANTIISASCLFKQSSGIIRRAIPLYWRLTVCDRDVEKSLAEQGPTFLRGIGG